MKWKLSTNKKIGTNTKNKQDKEKEEKNTETTFLC